MSDVTVAPQATPQAPQAAPAPNEAVINPNPVNAPSPVGPQAPPAPVGDLEGGKGRPESRRESIQRAFDKANRTEPAAAKPKIGHNQPPEETEKFDLKQPPKRETYREGGKFARDPSKVVQQPPSEQQPQPGQPQPAVNARGRELPEGAPYRDPPPRMAEHAKREWATAPESVRGEVHRMAQEFDGAYRRFRGDHEEMNSIREYHTLAQSHGTTLAKALGNYVGMEQKLRGDLVGGLDVIVNNLNLRTLDGQKLGLRDVAYHILQQSPDQHKLTQNQNAQTAQSQQIGQLHQMVESLAHGMQQMHYEKQFGQTRSAVDQFADAHPRFDELGELIEQELKLGFDLETAYRRAELLRPNARAAQTRTPTAQTRSDKSISGAPESSPSDGQRRGGKPIGRRDAIQNAIRRVNGGV